MEKFKSIKDLSSEYKYPRGVRLEKGSEVHENLLKYLLPFIRESYNFMRQKHSTWKTLDKNMKVFVDPDRYDAQKNIKDIHTDSDVKLIIPTSFAARETILTFLHSAFLQDPIFKFVGTGPEDFLGALMLEMVIDFQAKKKKFGLYLNNMWSNDLTYGIGPLHISWVEEERKRRVRSGSTVIDGDIITRDKATKVETYTSYEGNELASISPYSYFPDISVSAHEVDKGSFCGWIERINVRTILKWEAESNNFYNGKVVRYHSKKKSAYSPLEHKYAPRSTEDSSFTTPVDVIWIYADIIPKDFNIGNKKEIEKWVFAIAGDDTIIHAEPTNLFHGQFPIVVSASMAEDNDSIPLSRMFRISDLQDGINYYHNTFMANVRKSLNNSIIADPSLVSYNDLISNKSPKIIRLQSKAWGRNKISEAVKELQVSDFPSSNINMANILDGIAKTSIGATDPLQGSFANRTSRISSNEVERVSSSGLSRLKMIANIISMQAILPLGDKLASHTQQNMTSEITTKLTGDYLGRLKNNLGEVAWSRIPEEMRESISSGITIDPISILSSYDTIVSDGTIAGSESTQDWIQLYQIAASDPEIRRDIDLAGVFKHIARLLGAKNLSLFIKDNVQVVPDEQVQNETQQGNLIEAN